MTYLNNPRGKGQEAGYYLTISRNNQVKLMIVCLFSLFIISSLTSRAYSVKVETETSVKKDNRSNYSIDGLYDDLADIRKLVRKCDKLRAYNHRITGGPAPVLAKTESEHIRQNYRIIKEMEKEVAEKRKQLSKQYPILNKSSVSNSDLAFLGKEDLALALSVPAPSNSKQLAVLFGISLISMGMIGLCMKSLNEPNQNI